MAQLIADALPDELEACRRFANDVYAVALWAQTCYGGAQPASVARLLNDASALSTRCRTLLAAHPSPAPCEWRSFFTRLDAFVREIVLLQAVAKPSTSPDHLEALDRLSDLIAENRDLVAHGENAAHGIARAWVEAIDGLRDAFGIRGPLGPLS